MIARSLARGVLCVVALALAWVGFLAVGSWEATVESTTAGVVLVAGAATTIALVVASFMGRVAMRLLVAAFGVSAAAWVLAVLIE